MRGKLIVGLVAVVSLALLVAIVVYDVSIGRMLTSKPDLMADGRIDATEIETLFADTEDPEFDAYLKALRTQFPDDYAGLLDSLRRRAELGDDLAALKAAANAEAVIIVRANAKHLPYASAERLSLFFEGQVRLLEFARASYGDAACVEVARHGGAGLNARVMREPAESPLLASYLRDVIIAQRKLLFVMKEGRDAGPRELATPATEDWKALAERMRAEGAEKAHFDALNAPDTADEKTVCEAAILKSKALAALEPPAADTVRPHVARTMVGE